MEDAFEAINLSISLIAEGHLVSAEGHVFSAEGHVVSAEGHVADMVHVVYYLVFYLLVYESRQFKTGFSVVLFYI